MTDDRTPAWDAELGLGVLAILRQQGVVIPRAAAGSLSRLGHHVRRLVENTRPARSQ